MSLLISTISAGAAMYPTQPNLMRRYAPTSTGQLHLYDSGGDDIPIVLLHQTPMCALDFAATFPLFVAAGQRVIAVDTPGAGMSDAPQTPPSIKDYAVATQEALDHFGIKRAHLVGHHTGAQTAVEMAALRPERVGKVVLFGLPLLNAEEQKTWWDMVVPAQQEARVLKPLPDGTHLSDAFTPIHRIGGSVWAQRFVLSMLMAGPQYWYGANAALTHDSTPSLLAIQSPIMLMSNKGELRHANTLKAKDIRPDAELVVLETDGKVAMDSDPEAFVNEILAFVRR